MCDSKSGLSAQQLLSHNTPSLYENRIRYKHCTNPSFSRQLSLCYFHAYLRIMQQQTELHSRRGTANEPRFVYRHDTSLSTANCHPPSSVRTPRSLFHLAYICYPALPMLMDRYIDVLLPQRRATASNNIGLSLEYTELLNCCCSVAAVALSLTRLCGSIFGALLFLQVQASFMYVTNRTSSGEREFASFPEISAQ